MTGGERPRREAIGRGDASSGSRTPPPIRYDPPVRRGIRVTGAYVAALALVSGVSLAVGRWLELVPPPGAWDPFVPAVPARPLTLAEIEAAHDDVGLLRGRVRRTADGRHEVWRPKDDGALLTLALVGSVALAGAALLRQRESREGTDSGT